ncbi:hypothetical protein MKW94_012425 [Papaver nudicaule]|uniref:Glycosyltransferase n=1 Tax=Papaver nudicaule TaxID=74823 RepID=A0AA42AXU0_PAPNU|nr:hypothetical protein [Papaver nudicaule]
MKCSKPHVVCIPFPTQGHVNPMLKLAKLLHHKGFYVTFVNTEYNHQRLLNSRGPDSLRGLQDFKFETIPDGLLATDSINVTQEITALCDSTSKTCLVPFRKLLEKLNDSSSPSPPVKCIIAGGWMSFTLDAAEELGIPEIIFWTPSGCGFMAFLHYKDLIEKGLTPLKEESQLTNGYLEETKVDWIPGMKELRLTDLPMFIRTTKRDDIMLNFITSETQRSKRASAIVINTFDALEGDVLNAMKSLLPPVYSIGPLSSLLNSLVPRESEVNSLGSNLWIEDSGCIKWLDTKKANSVIYVNFGSITVITTQQMIEFAFGLANSKHTFLWIIRPDLVRGDSAILPPEFTTETKDRSMIASWCPQEEVLKHPSIGGFLTHSGWNSTLDAVTGGVPVVCWPFFDEQHTNCKYSCVDWGIGMEIDKNVKRNDVEKLVRELMAGEKGMELKKKVMEWKLSAEDAISSPHGSSYVNLDKLVNQILNF